MVFFRKEKVLRVFLGIDSRGFFSCESFKVHMILLLICIFTFSLKLVMSNYLDVYIG